MAHDEQMVIKIDSLGDGYDSTPFILYGKMKEETKGFKHESGYVITSYNPNDGMFKLGCAHLTRKEMHDLLIMLAGVLYEEEGKDKEEAKK